MHDVSEHRFSFALGDLPRGTFVKLSDALNLAFYGGVPSIRYEGAIPLSAVEDGGLCMGEDEWMLNTDDGPIQGPKLVNVARPGAILFGIEDRSKPDSAQQSEDKQTELALAPDSRQYGPDAGLSFWKAELVRRHGVFCSKLSMAARCGDVRLMGIPVEAPWALEPSTFASLPQDIPAAYFSVDRDFDEDSCIHAIGPEAPEPEYDEADGRYVSYRDVVVERASFLRFLKVTYPSVLNAARAQDQLKTKEAIRVLAQALAKIRTCLGPRQLSSLGGRCAVGASIARSGPRHVSSRACHLGRQPGASANHRKFNRRTILIDAAISGRRARPRLVRSGTSLSVATDEAIHECKRFSACG